MMELKPVKSAGSKHNNHLLKIWMVGCFLISILPFSFSQDFILRDVILNDYAGQHGTQEFKAFLDSMEHHGAEYFEKNCSQKACLIRHYGKYHAINRDLKTGFDFAYKAYEQIKTCEEIDPLIHLQILLNLESWHEYNEGNPITLEQSIELITKELDRTYSHINPELEKLIAQAYYRLMVYNRFYLKDYDRALIYGRKSIALYNKYPVVNNKPLRSLISLIATYTDAGKLDESIKYINLALQYSDQLNLTEPRYTSDLKFMIGDIYVDQEDYQKLDSLHARIKIDHPAIPFYQLPYQQAMAAFNQGSYAKANKLFSETEKILLNQGTETLLKQTSDFQAECYLHEKQYEKALPYILKAMQETTARLSINTTTNAINFNELIIINPLDFIYTSNKYLECVTEGNLISKETFLTTIDKLDSIYFDIQPTLVGPLSANILADNYHIMVGTSLKEVQKFYSSELKDFIAYYLSSGKSLSLFSNFIVSENIPEDVAEEYNTLTSHKASLASALSQANKNNDQNRIDSLSNVIYDVNKSLKKIYEKLTEINLSDQYRNNRQHAFENLKSNFTQGEFVVDLFSHEGDYFAYTYFQEKFTFHKLNLAFLKDTNIKTLYNSVDNYRAFEAFNKQLSDEFLKLFPENKKDITSIIIIPDGPLLEIPFESLLYNNKELIHQFPIYYLNSINDHYKRSTSVTSAKTSYAGFGLSYNDNLLSSINASTNIKNLFDNSFRLASLPNAMEELQVGKKVFKGDFYVEDDCTKTNFEQHATEANIIHITNHVLLNQSNSYLSSIVFANDDKEVLYNALDIKALDLNAELAILSSCNSGAGENFNGNGVRSIGQSFFEAGCQSVIVNLWEAGDKSSKKIISSFMDYLNQGIPKSEALQKAKLDFLKQASDVERHPKYWANIILIGNDHPISFKKTFPTYLYIIGGALLLAFLYYLYFKMAY